MGPIYAPGQSPVKGVSKREMRDEMPIRIARQLDKPSHELIDAVVFVEAEQNISLDRYPYIKSYRARMQSKLATSLPVQYAEPFEGASMCHHR